MRKEKLHKEMDSKEKSNKKYWFHKNPKTAVCLFLVFVLIFVESAGQLIYFFNHSYNFLFQIQEKKRNLIFTPYGLYEYKSNTFINMGFKYPASLEVDNYGFIHNGHRKDIEENEYLIFVVGGSTIEGRGASDNSTTLAAYLEKILNEKSRRQIRVINAAVLGFNSYQQSHRIDGKIIRDFKPDMIIAIDGRNDAYYMASYEEWQAYWQPYYDQITADINKLMRSSFTLVSFSNWLTSNFIIPRSFLKIGMKLFPKKNKIIHTRKDYVSDSIVERSINIYLSNHVSVYSKCKFLNIKYYVFLQPTLAPFLKNHISQEEKEIMDDWSNEYYKKDIYYRALEQFYKMVLKESRTSKLTWFFDISDAFKESREKIYFDSCHYTDQGNYVIASRVAEILFPKIRDICDN